MTRDHIETEDIGEYTALYIDDERGTTWHLFTRKEGPHEMPIGSGWSLVDDVASGYEPSREEARMAAREAAERDLTQRKYWSGYRQAIEDYQLIINQRRVL
jgi:hypothetical protein